MKLLAFTDIHEDKTALHSLMERAKQPDIDFLVSCGDISNFKRGLKTVLKELNSLGKKIYVVPGNHEEPENWFAQVLAGYPHWINLHLKVAKVGEYFLLGYGGGGFAMQDARFRKVAREWYGKYKEKKTVFIHHMPPFGTKLDLLKQGHVGNKDYANFIRRMKPKLAISGHLHETFGQIDAIDKTKIVNPGDKGMVIELK
ncbi:MAG TPA: metallophosphoesterase [Candidatus Nanoarchaeia archaeon]|nr:metallophosphoesterase [Candidatus Nanoarchaeia archaeon]